MRGPNVKRRQLADGAVVYDLRWEGPRTAVGERTQPSRTFDTEEDALVFWATQIAGGKGKRRPIRTGETVGHYLERWLAGRASKLAPSTVHQYDGYLRRHLVGIWDDELMEVTAADIEACYDREERRGIAPTTIRSAFAPLQGALADAVREGAVLVDVAPLVRLPKLRAPVEELRPWTDAEIGRFEAALMGREDEALWTAALGTGMRIGELLALRWAAVDLSELVVHIRLTVQQVKGGTIEGPPKGKRSRSCPLVGAVAAALVRHRDRQAFRRAEKGSAWIDQDRVFDRGNGGEWKESTARAGYAAVVAAAGVPYRKPHSLRAIAASTLIRAGVEPGLVADILGHKSYATTSAYYVRWSLEDKRAALARLGDELERVRAIACENDEQTRPTDAVNG